MTTECRTPAADTSFGGVLMSIKSASAIVGVKPYPLYRLTETGELSWFTTEGAPTRWVREADVLAIADEVARGRDLTAEALAEDDEED